MKNWIKVIFALNNKLDAMTYSIDGQVESLSKVTGGNTMELFDSIIKLNDKKVRLINMRVLHDKMKDALSEKEYRVITLAAKGLSFGDIAAECNIGKGHVYRIYNRLIGKLTKVLGLYGYDAEKFNSDYGDVMLISKTYKKLARIKEAG